ncbi:hypothetical protein K0M31_001547 [Melipona bicolor]|uniref:Uncharacterized protein n=1 Tax=Melipona bicolor TaxID=60889 RepID=A0AA40GGJ3_9HYME|nr:hypothetical protein K0M31_001547 [Melipona bicolor]
MPARTESRFIEISGNIISSGAGGRSERSEETPGWKQNGRRDEIEGRGCRSVCFGSGRWRMVAAASTEIMQLFHALVPVIGCTFAAEDFSEKLSDSAQLNVGAAMESRAFYEKRVGYKRNGTILAERNFIVRLNSWPEIELPPTNHDLIELADLFLVRGMKGSMELVLSQA